jgi:hypothetical protein
MTFAKIERFSHSFPHTMHSNKEKEILLYNVKEQIYKLLIDRELNGFVSIYEKYSRLFGLVFMKSN